MPTSKATSLHHSEEGALPAATVGRTKDRAPVFVVLLCLFQSCAGLLFGWESGVISGLINQVDYLQRFGTPDPTAASGYSIPTTRQALITSFMGLGALFGSLAAGVVSSKVGTKKATLLALFIFLIGVSVETSAQYQWGQIIAGRWIAGFGVGSMSMLAPLFQAECSPKHLRGIISSTFQLMATLGIFLANVVNYNSRSYSGMVFAVLFAFGTVMSPESPRYLLQRGNVDQARTNLAKLRDLPVEDIELEAEVQAILRGVQEEQAAADATYWDCFKSEDRYISSSFSAPKFYLRTFVHSMRLRTLIGIMVQAGQQWSGVNFFFSYGVKFFASAGISDSFLIQVILSAVNVLSTFPGLWAVENLGRRKTLFIGSAIMFVGQVVAGALGTAYPDGEIAGKILITFSCVFIFGFASTWGPLGWVVAAEQFPMRMAPYCVAWATGSNWFNNWLLAMITPYMTDAAYGNLQSKITFVWAGAIILFFLLTFFFVPETKGLSLVQVDELYLSNVPAWRSSSWEPYGGDAARHNVLKVDKVLTHHENAPQRNLDGED
ncbi:hypothetical protein RQP46_001451 [Phenoliferia psychrophenolica]